MHIGKNLPLYLHAHLELYPLVLGFEFNGVCNLRIYGADEKLSPVHSREGRSYYDPARVTILQHLGVGTYAFVMKHWIKVR